MKKILIANNNMHIGGVQKALLNLLPEIKDKYDITLFIAYNEGELKTELPEDIKIICGNRLTRIMGMSHAEAKSEGMPTLIYRSFWVLMTRVLGAPFVFRILSGMQKLEGNYDAAVSYLQSGAADFFYGGMNEIVLYSVRAEKKIAFIHCDFKNYEGNNKKNRKQYEKFDRIACVSESVKKNFTDTVPKVKDRVYTVRNCFNAERMQALSQEQIKPFNSEKINIFTAARIDAEKGIPRMIPIFKRLKDNNLNFAWYIAGDGTEYEKVSELIEKEGLSDSVFLLGNKPNPYPYFKQADLILVPSYHEAAPMVFGEAQAFGTMVLTTDTSSARELVLEKNIGYVCENNDNAIYNKLYEILRNPGCLKHYKGYSDNSEAAAEFDRIING